MCRVYYSFDYVTIKLIETGNWMVVFKEFLDTTVNLFTDELPNPSYTKYILSCAIGMPIPLISLSFKETKNWAIELEFLRGITL